MSADIFDTRFEGKDVELSANLVNPGDDVNLTAIDPAMRKIMIGMGWDLHAYDGDTVDADLSVFFLDRKDQTREDADFLFYNNMDSYQGAARHQGDSRTGAGDGDDETIALDLQGIPLDILRVEFVLSIYQAAEKGHDLSMVRNAFLRLVNQSDGQEILRFALGDLLAERKDTAVLLGGLEREGPRWHFRPRLDFLPGGLAEAARKYGMVMAGD